MIPTPRKNNGAPRSLTLGEAASLAGGQLIGGDKSSPVTGVAGIKEAEKGDITFLADDKYLPFLSRTKAAAVIVSKEIKNAAIPLIFASHPSRAFTRLAVYFAPAPVQFLPGIHPTAVIGKDAVIGEGVCVGPQAVIGEHSAIGRRSVIGAGAFIGDHCRLGQDVLIHPRVTVREYTQIGDRSIIHSGAVIGSDGFGYETDGGKHEKIPHTGYVLIEEDVEIGANACVDRGRFKKTWIRRGAKIDNLVQIAHNVIIGPDSLVVSQAGISGSTELGKNVIIAGQAGLVGHITVGDHAIIGAGAGVSKSVPEKAVVLGSPAKPIQEQKRLFAYISRLPELFKEMAQLKKKLSSRQA